MPDEWSDVIVLIVPNEYYVVPCHLIKEFMTYGYLYHFGSADVAAKLWCYNSRQLFIESVVYKDGVAYNTYNVDAYYR